MDGVFKNLNPSATKTAIHKWRYVRTI